MQRLILQHKRSILICIVLALAILAVYGQVRNFDFVYFDDNTYVVNNRHVNTGLRWNGVIWSFSFSFKDKSKNYWHPLTWLSHMTDCELFGLSAGKHHLSNLIFHLANSTLLFIVFLYMTGAFWQSAFVAAVFALHPINVESVAWVAERKNLLSTLFWLLTLFSYAYYVKKPGFIRYITSIVLFILGLLAKPMLVTLPFILLLLDYWPLGRIQFSDENQKEYRASSGNSTFSVPVLIVEKLPFLALSAASIWVSILAAQSKNILLHAESVPMKLRIANALVSYVSYIGKLFWPRDLAVLYPFPAAMLPTEQIAGALLFLAGISALVVRAFWRRPFLAVGWLWYLGTLVPVIGLVQAGVWPAMADRWAYIPFIGLFVMAAWGVATVVPVLKWRFVKHFTVVCAVSVLSVLALASWKQVRHWQNSIALFEHTLEVTSNNYEIHNNLGHVLIQNRRLDEGIDHCRKALKIKPNYPEAHGTWGNGAFAKGDIDAAITHYSEALRLNPFMENAYNNLGVALMKKGKLSEAIGNFQKALKLQPDYLLARKNLDQAIKQKGSARRDHFSYHQRGNMFKETGRLDQAVALYQKALSIQPDYIPALNDLALAHVEKGAFDLALTLYQKIISLRPGSYVAYYNIACLYARQNQTESAVKWLEKAVQRGFKDWRLLETDEDLKNIRMTPYYKSLTRAKRGNASD